LSVVAATHFVLQYNIALAGNVAAFPVVHVFLAVPVPACQQYIAKYQWTVDDLNNHKYFAKVCTRVTSYLKRVPYFVRDDWLSITALAPLVNWKYSSLVVRQLCQYLWLALRLYLQGVMAY